MSEAQNDKMEPDFERFWESYPSRNGANPRYLAELKYKEAIKAGADPAYILSSLKIYHDRLRDQHLLGTIYVCQAKTWLHQKRWLDYPPVKYSAKQEKKINKFMKSKGYEWTGERWQKLPEQPGKYN